jgi:hypothetical protein
MFEKKGHFWEDTCVENRARGKTITRSIVVERCTGRHEHEQHSAAFLAVVIAQEARNRPTDRSSTALTCTQTRNKRVVDGSTVLRSHGKHFCDYADVDS